MFRPVLVHLIYSFIPTAKPESIVDRLLPLPLELAEDKSTSEQDQRLGRLQWPARGSRSFWRQLCLRPRLPRRNVSRRTIRAGRSGSLFPSEPEALPM